MLLKTGALALAAALSLLGFGCGGGKMNNTAASPTPTPGAPSPGGGAASISGVVQDGNTHSAVGGSAVVALEQQSGATWVVVSQTAPDAAGNFSFGNAGPGSYALVVSASDSSGQVYAPTVLLSVPAGSNVGTMPVLNPAPNPKFVGDVLSVNAARAGVPIHVTFFVLASVDGTQVTVPSLGTAPSLTTVVDPNCLPPKGNWNGPPGCAQTQFPVSAEPTIWATYNGGTAQFQAQGTGATLALGANATSVSTGQAACTPSSQTAAPYTFTSNLVTVDPGGFLFSGC